VERNTVVDYLQYSPIEDLEGREAVKQVQKYFKPGGRFSGRQFEFIGGRGDAPEVAHRFTAEDLVAVSLLSVNIPGNVAIEILTTRAEEFSELLSQIPLVETLWGADESVVDDHDSVAADLWRQLERIHGVGWVTANKLLARKRPHLLPVYDRVVKAKLQPRSKKFWIPLRNTLLRDDGAIIHRLEEIKDQADLDVDPSLLRILDVVVWMGSGRY
jgi:hypothetical protein